MKAFVTAVNLPESKSKLAWLARRGIVLGCIMASPAQALQGEGDGPPPPRPPGTPPSAHRSDPIVDVHLKGAHGKYLVCDTDQMMKANRDAAAGWETFNLQLVAPNTIGVLARNGGRYASAQPDGSVTCDRTELKSWEVFELVVVDPTHVGLRSDHGKYLSAQPDGTLVADRDVLAGWETFEVEFLPGVTINGQTDPAARITGIAGVTPFSGVAWANNGSADISANWACKTSPAQCQAGGELTYHTDCSSLSSSPTTTTALASLALAAAVFFRRRQGR